MKRQLLIKIAVTFPQVRTHAVILLISTNSFIVVAHERFTAEKAVNIAGIHCTLYDTEENIRHAAIARVQTWMDRVQLQLTNVSALSVSKNYLKIVRQ